MSLESIVDVQISAETRFPTRAGFGTPLVVGHHTKWLDRVRSYGSLGEAEADGIVSTDPQTNKIHRAIAAMFSQNPRPRIVKVGRRVGAPVQSIRLTPTEVAEGWTYAFTVGGVRFAYEAQSGDVVSDVTAALSALVAADDDAILDAQASAATLQELTGAALDGVIGDDAISPPRNLTVTTSTHADFTGGTLVVEGTDPAGRTISESFTITSGGGDALTGSKVFASVTKVTIPAQGGTGGSVDVGVGIVFVNDDLDITATDGTTHLDVAADVAGEWFAFDGFDARLEVEDRTADPATGIATDLSAMLAEDADFYGVILADGSSRAQILAAAAWVEARPNPGKLLVAHSMDSAVVSDAETDIATALLAGAYYRTVLLYHRGAHGSMPHAAWAGVMLPTDPGSATWEFKELRTVPVDAPSASDVANLEAKNAAWYVRIRGKNVTRNGKTGAGEWVDVVRFIDWVKDEIAVDVFDEISGSPKTPYTAGGIDSVVGRIRQVGRRAIAVGGLDPDQELTVIAPDIADVSAGDLAARRLTGVSFDWRLAGAIHAATIRGNLTV